MLGRLDSGLGGPHGLARAWHRRRRPPVRGSAPVPMSAFDTPMAGRPAVPCAPYGIVNVPFVMPDPPYISMFSMSQWSSSFSMQAFGAGWGVLVYTVFYVLADELGAAWSLLTVLSQNALLHYMLRDFVFTFIRDIFPSDAPLWMICVLVPLSLLLNLSLAYYLKRNSLYLRV